MRRTTPEAFTAPVFLGTAFLLIGIAIVEKGLNVLGTGLPVVNFFPRQVLDWAVTLMILEIAITLRQIAEVSRANSLAAEMPGDFPPDLGSQN